MLLRLFLLFTIVPVIELAILIEVGRWIGAGTTIVFLILSGIVGAALARHEGLRTLRHIQEDLGAGRLPTDRLIDGLLILAAGILLITPGLLTDAVGYLLLIPPIRRLVRNYLKKRFQAKLVVMHPGSFRPFPDDDLIDGEARSQDEWTSEENHPIDLRRRTS
jgi:UPF0716 protein FxsA